MSLSLNHAGDWFGADHPSQPEYIVMVKPRAIVALPFVMAVGLLAVWLLPCPDRVCTAEPCGEAFPLEIGAQVSALGLRIREPAVGRQKPPGEVQNSPPGPTPGVQMSSLGERTDPNVDQEPVPNVGLKVWALACSVQSPSNVKAPANTSETECKRMASS